MKTTSELTKAVIFEFLTAAIIAAPLFIIFNILIGISKAL